MTFPSKFGGFPGASSREPLRPHRKAKKAPALPPPDEQTHVAMTKFKLGCGASRIKTDRELIVSSGPTCPGCRGYLHEQAKTKACLDEFFGNRATEW